GPYMASLSVFTNTDPTGVWSLYVLDDSSGDSGSISGGWNLKLVTQGSPVCCGPNSAADLAVTMGASPNPVPVTSNVVFSISVANNGPNPASDALLTDQLPQGLTFISANSTRGICYTNGSTVYCSLGTMSNGANATITITANATIFGTLTNTSS